MTNKGESLTVSSVLLEDSSQNHISDEKKVVATKKYSATSGTGDGKMFLCEHNLISRVCFVDILDGVQLEDLKAKHDPDDQGPDIVTLCLCTTRWRADRLEQAEIPKNARLHRRTLRGILGVQKSSPIPVPRSMLRWGWPKPLLHGPASTLHDGPMLANYFTKSRINKLLLEIDEPVCRHLRLSSAAVLQCYKPPTGFIDRDHCGDGESCQCGCTDRRPKRSSRTTPTANWGYYACPAQDCETTVHFFVYHKKSSFPGSQCPWGFPKEPCELLYVYIQKCFGDSQALREGTTAQWKNHALNPEEIQEAEKTYDRTWERHPQFLRTNEQWYVEACMDLTMSRQRQRDARNTSQARDDLKSGLSKAAPVDATVLGSKGSKDNFHGADAAPPPYGSEPDGGRV